MLPALLVFAGLVLEGGLMMAVQGELEATADAAAQLAAWKRMQGEDLATATAVVEQFVATRHPLAAAPEVVVQTPASGPHTGEDDYVEVQLKGVVAVGFLAVMGIDTNQPLTARAVAGVEPISSGARIIALRSDEIPGLSIVGAGEVRVNGGVMVNSTGGGVDARGEPLDNGGKGEAAKVAGSAALYADDVQVVGGVNDPALFLPFVSGARPPLRTDCRPIEDPLADLPVPQGNSYAYRGSASITMGLAMVGNGNTVAPSGDVTLLPGVYDSIDITGGIVTFQPGVYILRGGATTVLRITGGTISGAGGVMFYNTGHDFDPATGLPDRNDVSGSTANPTNSKFGGIVINHPLSLQPSASDGDPYFGLIIFQRRVNPQPIELQGQGNIRGGIYAASAALSIAGQGTIDGQFVVGSFDKAGNGNLLIDCQWPAWTAAQRVFLVE